MKFILEGLLRLLNENITLPKNIKRIMDAKETLAPCTAFPFETTPKSPEAPGSKTGYQQLYINTVLKILTVMPVHTLNED